MGKNKVGLIAKKPDLVHVSKGSSMVVEDDKAKFLAHHIRESSQKTYDKAIRQLEALGLEMPCTPDELTSFMLRTMANQKMNTLKLRLVAISRWHIWRNLPDPTKHPDVKKAKKSVANLKDKAGEQVQQVAPIIVDLVARVNTNCVSSGTLNAKRDRVVMLIMYYAALRSEEVCSLRLKDVSFQHDGVMVFLWASKTGNKYRFIPYNEDNHEMCVVGALEEWIEAADITDPESWLIRGFYKGCCRVRETKLTTKSIRDLLKMRLNQAGYKGWDSFSGQSPRRGFVKDAIDGGIDLLNVAEGGGWRSLDMLQTYYQATRATATRAIMKGTKDKY